MHMHMLEAIKAAGREGVSVNFMLGRVSCRVRRLSSSKPLSRDRVGVIVWWSIGVSMARPLNNGS
jgi:hypothetical protein